MSIAATSGPLNIKLAVSLSVSAEELLVGIEWQPGRTTLGVFSLREPSG
jgi:hypothetical protein